MTKTHQIWQAINFGVLGFIVGQSWHPEGHLVAWLMAAWVVSYACSHCCYRGVANLR